MMTDEHILNFGDIVYSCLIPHDCHWEHRMPTHSIVFVRSGMLVVRNHGEETQVSAGNYVFLRRDCKVDVKKVSLGDVPYRGVLVTLPRKTLKDYCASINLDKRRLKDARPVKKTATFLPKTVELEGLFNSLLPYIDQRTKPSDEMLALKLREVIMALLSTDKRFYPTLFDFNESWKIDLMAFMEHNFTEDLTLEEFASYTGRSLATFKRDFAKLSDVSPQRWIIDHRLDLAYQLITHGDSNTTDVAYRVGFKNRSHFSTAFKQKFGCAPRNLVR